MKHLKYFRESSSQEENIELVEDLFILDIADKWVLSNNNLSYMRHRDRKDISFENCWEVTKDKLVINIKKNKLRGKKLKLWDEDLDKFFSRLEKLGYKVEKPRLWCIDLRTSFYYHIYINKNQI